tara:strand:+ start:4701 stop:6800 length:2100 start_codon:yes stop_codon:yes gene_type:complete
MTSAFESSFTLRAKAEGFAALEQSIRRIAKAMIQAQQSSGGGTGIARNQQMAQKQAQQMFQGAYGDPRLAGAKQDKAGKWRTAKGQFLPKDLQAIAQRGTGLEGVGFGDLQRVQGALGPEEEGGMGMGGAGKFVAREVRTQQQTQMKAENAQAKENVAIVEKENQARATLNTTVGRRIESGKQMLVLDKALGDQSRISTADVAKLRFSINRLKSSQDFQKFATQSQIESLRALEMQLKKLQAQQYNNASSFTFMAGVGQKAKTAVKQVGAASQGMMLAMSAANGDVMGLAFSLIFLQFAANLPVALGFAAIAIAGVLAFKGIKKVLDTKKEMKLFTTQFAIATGSVQAYSLAQDRAAESVKQFGLTGEVAEGAKKTAIQAILELERRGIEATQANIGVAIKAYVLLHDQVEEEAEAVKQATEATIAFAESAGQSIVEVDGLTYSLDGLNEAAARAMGMLGDSVITYGETWGDTLKSMGIEEENWTESMIRNADFRMEKLSAQSGRHSAVGRTIIRQIKDLTKADDENYTRRVEYSANIIAEYDRVAEHSISSTSILLEESKKTITAMQEEAAEKTKSIQTIIDQEKHLDNYYRTKKASKQEYLDLSKRSFEAMKPLDQEYSTGTFEGEYVKPLVDLPKWDTTYYDNQTMKELDRGVHPDRIEITINDQTSRGTAIDTAVRNAGGGMVFGSVSMSGEGGN